MIRLAISIVKWAAAPPHFLRHSEATQFLRPHGSLGEPLFGSATSSVGTTQLYLLALAGLQTTALTKVKPFASQRVSVTSRSTACSPSSRVIARLSRARSPAIRVIALQPWREDRAPHSRWPQDRRCGSRNCSNIGPRRTHASRARTRADRASLRAVSSRRGAAPVLRQRPQELETVRTWHVMCADEQEAGVGPLRRLMQRESGVLVVTIADVERRPFKCRIDLAQPVGQVSARHLIGVRRSRRFRRRELDP
jgi:hypothetical protein